jgi:hypothetical protein
MDSRYIAASYQSSEQSVWRDVCVTAQSVRCLEAGVQEQGCNSNTMNLQSMI